jgi:peptide/nickel transport system substrate-binding protein
MDRRAFLKSAAGAVGAARSSSLATPAISQGASAKALRFVPSTDLANFDPIWTTSDAVRDAGFLVWDTLYGLDQEFQPQRQMIEAEEVSADGLITVSISD